MVESHDIDINDLRAYVYQAVEAYNGKIENLENADAQTLMVIAKLVHKLNDAKERIKELELNNAKWDTIYLALHELGESSKMMGQFLTQRFEYSPHPLTHVPEKINSAQYEYSPQADQTEQTDSRQTHQTADRQTNQTDIVELIKHLKLQDPTMSLRKIVD